MINHKRNKRDIVQQTIDLINSYNEGKERCLILMRNSNEIRPLPSENEGVAVGVRDPNKLYNKISKPENKKEAIK